MIGATRGLGIRLRVRDLAGQPGAGVGVVRDVLAQHLDRDRAAVPVEREVHHAHPALAEALHEAVLPEARVLTRLLGLVLRLGAVGDGVGGHAHHGKRVLLGARWTPTLAPARRLLAIAHREGALEAPRGG